MTSRLNWMKGCYGIGPLEFWFADGPEFLVIWRRVIKWSWKRSLLPPRSEERT